MPFNRTSSRVAIGLFAILLASPTFGQGPLGFQIFAPADVSTYGGAIEPNEGYFFQFDGLYWSVSPPKTSYVGLAPPAKREVNYGPNVIDRVDQYSTLNTSQIKDQFSPGNRFEFGRVEDRNGWFVSIYQIRDQEQDATIPAANVVFNDPPFGPADPVTLQQQAYLWGPVGTGVNGNLPVTLYDVLMNHSIDTWGVELMYLHRMRTCHNGGTFELFGGARYLEFNDTFGIQAGADPGGTVPSFLAGSSWESVAENHVVGPEVGLRWFKKQGRWTLSTEGRFMAGLNCQNIHEQVNLGPNLSPGSHTTFYPTVLGPTTATYSANAREFSPVIELRLEGRYQITRAISFHAGWTGVWMDNIARGSGTIDYSMPAMGIDMSRNREDLLMNGLTLGFDVNR